MNLARTTLRNSIGTLSLKSANSERGKINTELQKTLREETSHQLLRRLQTVERALATNAKIVIPSGTELVNVIGELAGVLPLDGGRRPAIVPAPASSTSDMVEGPALH